MENRLVDVILGVMEQHEISTQKEMAARLGMDEAALSRLLRMKPSKQINVDVMARLYSEFGITPNDVLLHES